MPKSKNQRRAANRRARMYAAGHKRNPTHHEEKLRDELARRGIAHEFQKPIGPWIVDFYLPKWRVVVEVDGASHSGPEAQAKDTKRSIDLCTKRKVAGVIRVRNGELHDMNAVIGRILDSARRLWSKRQAWLNRKKDKLPYFEAMR